MEVDGASRVNAVRDFSPERRTRPNRNSNTQERSRDYSKEDLMKENINERLEEQLEEYLERLNDLARIYDKELNFQLHEDTERYFVQVVDVIEDEIIREISPEDILDIMAQIDDMIGLIEIITKKTSP